MSQTPTARSASARTVITRVALVMCLAALALIVSDRMAISGLKKEASDITLASWSDKAYYNEFADADGLAQILDHGYTLDSYSYDDEHFTFCISSDAGAWAAYDSNEAHALHTSTSGSCPA